MTRGHGFFLWHIAMTTRRKVKLKVHQSSLSALIDGFTGSIFFSRPFLVSLFRTVFHASGRTPSEMKFREMLIGLIWLRLRHSG
jgi:hypothetical protein